MFHRKNAIPVPVREGAPVRPRSGNRLLHAEAGLRAAPWLLAALAALATAILLALAAPGTARAGFGVDYDMALRGWNTNINVYWNSQSEETYRYKIRKTGGEWSGWNELEQIPEERHEHTITGLDAGFEYQVKLQFCTELYPGGCHDIGTGSARVMPAAPKNLSYTLNDNYSVTLTWDDPQDPSLVEYLYRITAAGEESDWIRAIDFTANTPPENTTSYTVPADELSEGVGNLIELMPRNHAGGSSASVTVSVPDQDAPPYQPEEPVQPTPGE